MPSSRQLSDDLCRGKPSLTAWVHPSDDRHDLDQIHLLLGAFPDPCARIRLGRTRSLACLADSSGHSLKCGITRPKKQPQTAHFPFHRLVTWIGTDCSAPEVGFNHVKYLAPVFILAYGHAWTDFPPHPELRSRRDGDREAAFTIEVPG